MKIVFCTLIVQYFVSAVFRVAHAIPISEIIDLGAVTNFPGLEKYYIDIRTGPQNSDEPPVESPSMLRNERIKKRICENVFKSHFFAMQSQQWINVDDEIVRSRLQDRYETLFRLLFVEAEIPLDDEFVYDNPHRRRAVLVDDLPIQEYGFSCLAMDSPYKKIREYFVSRAYNVNTLTGYRISPIAGRFIFAHDDRDQLQLVAMAEECVLEWSFLRWTQLAGFVYAYSRLWDELEENPEDDAICNIPEGFKLRLCASLFASKPLKNEVTFAPTMDSVGQTCELRDSALSKFHWGVYSRFESVLFPLIELDRYIAEWVIGCKARIIRTGKPITYYVSHGSHQNTIFVYKKARFTRRKDRIAPWNFFYNASVVDRGTEDLPSMNDIAGNLMERVVETALF